MTAISRGLTGLLTRDACSNGVSYLCPRQGTGSGKSVYLSAAVVRLRKRGAETVGFQIVDFQLFTPFPTNGTCGWSSLEYAMTKHHYFFFTIY